MEYNFFAKLYLNLNAKVQSIWTKDKAALIETADGEWTEIKDKAAKDL